MTYYQMKILYDYFVNHAKIIVTKILYLYIVTVRLFVWIKFKELFKLVKSFILLYICFQGES